MVPMKPKICCITQKLQKFGLWIKRVDLEQSYIQSRCLVAGIHASLALSQT